MTDNGTAVATRPDPRAAALLKAVGFDRLAPEQRELALAIAGKYELDTMLKHLVMIDGRPYITRDGLLHVAHRSGQLDGIETTEPGIVDGFWRASCSVYRKDMSRPFTYTGRYPTSGGNQKFAPEMAVKVAEVMALRRAFDVAAPVVEERWDIEAVPSASAAQPTLAQRAAQRAAIVVDPTPQEAAIEPAVAPEVAEDAADVADVAAAQDTSPTPPDAAGATSSRTAAEPPSSTTCGNASPFGDGGSCGLPVGHTGRLHRQLDVAGRVTGSWPTT